MVKSMSPQSISLHKTLPGDLFPSPLRHTEMTNSQLIKVTNIMTLRQVRLFVNEDEQNAYTFI